MFIKQYWDKPLVFTTRKTLLALHHAHAPGNTGGVSAYRSPMLR